MKKVFVFLLLLGSINFAEADPIKKPERKLTEEQKVLLAQIEKRTEEIKAMDFSTLSKEEKAELKAEMKEMRKKAVDNGIYLSFGAIIIILLLLILLL
ncbi:MAG: hypothetical protein LPK25_02710 [Cyclobacteriaceae bacterium]|nr:hypothetical protein [Cyclobacteriaceae bacterium]MDX5465701.1 hypothetical protein [Cyclobacteriaceae bacterium]